MSDSDTINTVTLGTMHITLQRVSNIGFTLRINGQYIGGDPGNGNNSVLTILVGDVISYRVPVQLTVCT